MDNSANSAGRLRQCRRGAAALLGVLLAAGFLQALSPPSAAATAAETPAPQVTTETTEAAAAAAARTSGRRVEVASLRRETSEVYALPSGLFEAVQHLRPIRTRKNGRWVGVDPTLRRLPDGAVAPVASSVDLRFSAGGTEPFVRMSRAGRQLAFSWPGRLPVPTLDGDAATYAEVLPGVDLLLRADVDGFAHLVVVKTQAAAKNPELARLRLKLDAPGLVVKADPAGVLRATDAVTGGLVFEAPAPLMWDSTRFRSSGRSAQGSPAPAEGGRRAVGPGDGAKTAPVKVGLGRGELALVPDQSMLAAADTTFPVYIDPSWSSLESAWLMVSSGYPTTSYYKFDGKSTEGVGFCDVSLDGACVRDQRKRLFFRMPLTRVAGTYVISAEFVAYETDAYNCSDPTSVQLWHASGFGSTSTWNTTSDNWIQHLTSRDVAYCSSTPVEFGGTNLRDVVRAAASRRDSAITFGLRAYSESSMAWWKRFADDAALRIVYNTPPPQPLMKNLSMSPGGPCVDWTAPPTVNRLPTLYAILTDPDSEDAKKLYAQFRITWDTSSWTSALIGPKTTGSTFQVTAPSTIPQNKQLHWHVRTWDGYEWSPWSWSGSATSCYFFYDATAPAAPTVSSTVYPPSDPENPDDPWYDGVGRYGQFTITTTNADVNRYWVGINATPTQAGEYRPATPGGPVTVSVVPTRAGVNFLYVKALDAAGNVSAPATYMFRVAAGSAPKAHWKLDEPAGATALAAVTRAGEPAVTAQTTGGVTLGVDGQAGTAMRTDGVSGFAGTGGPVVDTSASYAVAAWVRLANDGQSATVVSQAGSHASGLQLYYYPTSKKWFFNKHQTDTDTTSGIQASSDTVAEAGVWTHLVGVFDAVTQRLQLYVNGQLQQAQPTFTSPAWNATGSFEIGRAWYRSAWASYFPGDIDDVRVFDRIVTGDEAADLYRARPVLAGRWKLNTDGVDDSGKGRNLAMGGNARVDQAAGWLGDPQGGLVLDGVGDFAATSGPVVSTNRSFTVAGWVTSAGAPTSNAAVFSQEGTINSGFTLRYAPGAAGGAGGWEIEMPDADAAGAARQTADHPAFQWQLQWDHVAIVYDSFADVMRLYVNGAEEKAETDVSARWNTLGFDATKPLQLGRSKTGGVWGEYWPGVIDDVWAFSGVLSEEQVQALAGYTELPSDSPF